MVTAHEALWSKYNFDSKIESMDGNMINSYTGSPKSSLLYFISLYFGTIELVKQNHWNKNCLSQSNSLFSYLLCHLLTRIFDLCTPAPKLRVREYIFQPHIFCIL